jgi:arylsulfatase A-like enzyme
MEHGQLRHRKHLYDESIRVPLIVVGPGILAAHRQEQAQGIDLHPTLAAVLGLPPSAVPLPGHSLLEPLPARPAISETMGGFFHDGRSADLIAARTPGWKVIDAPALDASESYDLTNDPGEHTILPREAGEGPALHASIDGFVRDAPPPPAREGYDPTLREKLRALGYTD